MGKTRDHKIKIVKSINYIDDLIPRLKISKQRIEKSISERKRILFDCELKIASKKTIRDSLMNELREIEKSSKL